MKESILQLIMLSNELLKKHCNLNLDENAVEHSMASTEMQALSLIKLHLAKLEEVGFLLNAKSLTQWSTNIYLNNLSTMLNELILQKDLFIKIKKNNITPFAEKFISILTIIR